VIQVIQVRPRIRKDTATATAESGPIYAGGAGAPGSAAVTWDRTD
jgi:hypothetical protein